MSGVEKQYGLIEPRTGKKLTVNDVFNNDSDSGGEQDLKLSKKFGQKDEKGVKRQTKLEMQRALQQDPTVYKYDEIYDEMTQKKQELEQTKVNPEKKPKYIQNLMKTAERRKKENERRLERQIQKEREAEGDIYKDKEEFITSSYKQKLEEFKKAEEEEKKMEYIESVMDVSKQQDLGGFYRHLYKETVPDQNPGDKKPEKEEESVKKKEKTPNADPEDKLIEPIKQHERNYRKRQHSESPNRSENKEKDSSSSSSDSDSSTDSSSSSSSSDDEKSETKETEVKQNESKSGPEDGEIVELDRKKLDKSKLLSKPIKVENKTGLNDEKLRNGSRSFKQDDRDRRDRNFRSSGYDRGRSRNISRRDDRNYRDQDRERDRDRERERERRDDRKMHDRVERKSNDSRRRRSQTPDRRRKSRERSSERTRLRRGSERMKDKKAVKLNNTSVSTSNPNDNDDGYGDDDDDDDDGGGGGGGGGGDDDDDDGVKKKKVKELKEEVKETDEMNETKMEEVEVKINIWEKRTVGAVFEAAVERYKLRKASRNS